MCMKTSKTLCFCTKMFLHLKGGCFWLYRATYLNLKWTGHGLTKWGLDNLRVASYELIVASASCELIVASWFCELRVKICELRVVVCELILRVASWNLRVVSCSARVDFASCELKFASCEFQFASQNLRVQKCELRVSPVCEFLEYKSWMH